MKLIEYSGRCGRGAGHLGGGCWEEKGSEWCLLSPQLDADNAGEDKGAVGGAGWGTLLVETVWTAVIVHHLGCSVPEG